MIMMSIFIYESVMPQEFFDLTVITNTNTIFCVFQHEIYLKPFISLKP